MRNFSDPKIWSHGTNLGYLGSLNQKALDKIFSKVVFLDPFDVPEGPVIVASLFHAKILKTFPTRCDPRIRPTTEPGPNVRTIACYL